MKTENRIHREHGWSYNISTLHARLMAWGTAFTVIFLTATGAHADQPIPPYVQSAIAQGLHWLSEHQLPSGTFKCAPAARPAVTSLAVMAFMARGYTPGAGPYHQIIDRGMDWVMNHQRASGYLVSRRGGSMYDHGIATVMLSEVYGMAEPDMRRRIGHALSKAVALILAAQDVPKIKAIFDGGWRYQPKANDADISVTGWQLMALRGAADSGAPVPMQSIKNGIAFILRDVTPSGGFSYQPGGPPGNARTGTGVLMLELMGQRNSPQAINGGNFLLAHPLNPRQNFYYYAVYYCAQAANQLGGKYYQHIYFTIRDQLIKIQASNGAWTPTDGSEKQGGNAYATAMAILALCVPYHYLPLYQR